jgi:hypothetical protein
MRGFLSFHGSEKLAKNALPPQKASIARMASQLARRFVEPASIDHSTGIFTAQLPPFFASNRRDDF